MREILFRGKTKEGEWAQGDLLIKGFDYETAIRKLYEENNMLHGSIIKVTPETVGQYTGLSDKNGTKVFEGDILSFSYNEKDENVVFYSIEWKSDRACFGYAETADKIIEVDCLHCEVIGNIHDNPELLEGSVDNASKT